MRKWKDIIHHINNLQKEIIIMTTSLTFKKIILKRIHIYITHIHIYIHIQLTHKTEKVFTMR